MSKTQLIFYSKASEIKQEIWIYSILKIYLIFDDVKL